MTKVEVAAKLMRVEGLMLQARADTIEENVEFMKPMLEAHKILGQLLSNLLSNTENKRDEN